MSVQPLQPRTWPKIFAARGDGPGTGISPLYITPSRPDIPPRESEHGDAGKPNQEFGVQIEEMFKDAASEQRFSSRKTGKKQVRTNDEEALAGIMKEINNEVESFQTLYNNQWFSNKDKASDAMKPMQHSTKPDAFENTIEVPVDEIPLKVTSNKDTHFTKNVLHKSSMQDSVTQRSKLKTREQDKELERELSKLNLSQKTVSSSPSHTESITSEKVLKKSGNLTSSTGRSVSTLTDTDSPDFKRSVGGISTLATQTENVRATTTQARTSTSREDTGVTEPLSLADSQNPLTEAERQTFKAAINAMNAETEREEKKKAVKTSSKSLAARRSGLLRTSKEHRKSAGAADTSKEHRKSTERTPIWSSSRIARVDVKKYNRQSSTGNVAQSQSATNKPRDVRRVSDIHVDKQRAAPEPLVKRKMEEKQKTVLYHGFPYTQPKSLTSIPNIKNGNFQAGFVKAVPLENGVLHVSPSAPLVSKHYPRKTLPPTTSQSKVQRRHPQAN